MLTRLSISNYALIERLDIELSGGLTIITGETGAGKSIIMGALSLLLGERVDSRVTGGDSKTIVEANFDIASYRLERFFEDNDIDYEPHECIVRREVSPSGRSRAFVNDTPVSLSLLRDLATRLVDIHSQHSNMLLSTAAYQLQVLDSIAGNETLLGEYTTVYKRLMAARRELEELQRQLAEARAEQDYLQFQYTQLAEANLVAGEDAELESLQARLANVESLKHTLWEAEALLDNEQHSLLGDLQQVATRLQSVAEHLDEAGELAERVRSCHIELKDIAATVESLQETLVHDPETLQRVEDRLNDLFTLQRKHNVSSVEGLIAMRDELQSRLEKIDGADDQVTALQATIDELTRQAGSLAAQLHERRLAAANSLTTQLTDIAGDLAMKNLRFNVAFATTELATTGTDSVEFLFAFNKNQQPMPVRDTASGGEISRVMLCIKTILARVMQLPTIIFDEIDTGVSGDVAGRIGGMMHEISRNIQVLAITHLPQVAAYADNHLLVYKQDDEQRTFTGVESLDDEGHLREVARMLSGRDVTREALDNARVLINLKSK